MGQAELLENEMEVSARAGTGCDESVWGCNCVALFLPLLVDATAENLLMDAFGSYRNDHGGRDVSQAVDAMLP